MQNTFKQWIEYDSDPTDTKDQKLFTTNQAPFGVWYQQNAMNADPASQWRPFLAFIYAAVQDGLGRQVIEQGAFGLMSADELSAGKIAADMFGDKNLDAAIVDKLVNDAHYGTADPLNLVFWNALTNTEDPAKKLNKLAWQWEMATYFGLSLAQVETFT